MKHLILIAAIALATTTSAPAQVAGVVNSSYSQIGQWPNSTSAASDSVLSHIRILAIPSSGRIILMADDADKNVLSQAEVIIYNNAGYAVARKPVTTGTNDIYISNLSNGLYFLRLIQKNGQSAVEEFGVLK